MATTSTGANKDALNTIGRALDRAIQDWNTPAGGKVTDELQGSPEQGDSELTEASTSAPVQQATTPVDPNPAKRQSKDKQIADDELKKQQEARQSSLPATPQSSVVVYSTQKTPDNSEYSIRQEDGHYVVYKDSNQVAPHEGFDSWDSYFQTNPVIDGKQFSEWENESGATPIFSYAQQQQQQQQQQQKKSSNKRKPKQPATPNVPGKQAAVAAQQQNVNTGEVKTPAPPVLPERKKVEKFYQDANEVRISEANQRDLEKLKQQTNYTQNRKQKHRGLDALFSQPSQAEQTKQEPIVHDSELFANRTQMNKEQRKTEPKNVGPQRTEADPNAGSIFEEKDTHKQDNLIDQTMEDIMFGFFHVSGEKMVKDENGNDQVKYSDDGRLEEYMNGIFEYINKEDNIDNRRNLFRSIRLAAGMSVDRDGKMFREDSDNWELTEDEMIAVMRNMYLSAKLHGTPFAWIEGSELGNTEMFPCGVVPKVVAEWWTGPGSNLDCTAAELVQRTQDQWTTRTYPALKLRTVNNIGQRIVLEDMNRAISMLDGMTPERFSERYGIRSEIDYMIKERIDSNITYVAAMNNSVDAQAVADRENRKIQAYKAHFDKNRGVIWALDKNGQKEVVEIRKMSNWVAGLKLVTKCARTTGVALNAPVIISAFMEHGVGNFRSKIAIAAINKALGTDYKMSDFAIESMRSDESIEAFQCVKELYDHFGPGAVRLFAQTGKPYTKENVQQFVNNKLKQQMSDKLDKWNDRLNSFTHKLMVADYAFRRSDVMLWFNAFITTNAIMANDQSRQLEVDPQTGEIIKQSEREVPLTPEEIESAIRASTSMGSFFAQAMGTDAGINAYNMMKANNIGQVSPLSHSVDEFLRDHAVTEFMITEFVDTYPRYGMSFIYMLVPFSRTMSYIKAKQDYSQSTGDMKSDLLIGGNIEDFQMGLRMNLIYDAISIGQNVLVGGLLGLVLSAIGFEPPEDDQNINNVSMWRIGSKVGWGEVDEHGNYKGIEIQLSWWLNDLSLLSFPIAYLTAGIATNQDLGRSFNLMMSSLHDTVEGNVLLDFANTVKHFREDYIEFNRMIDEPDYEGPRDLLSFAQDEMKFALGVGLSKSNPLSIVNPVYNMINRDTLFAGEEARNRDFSHVYKHSDNSEEMEKWYAENNITGSTTYEDYLRRKYSSSNLFYALCNDLFINKFDDKKTGYLWWEMPVRTMKDPVGYGWLGQLAMDYDNMCEELGISEEYYNSLDEEGRAQVKAQYDEAMVNKVLEYIETFGIDNAQEAIKVGFVLPTTTRKAMCNVLYGRINANWNEYYAKCESGELSTYIEQQEAKNDVYDKNNKLKNIIYNWAKNENIPTYAQEYEQLLTDYDVSYINKDTNQAVPDYMRFFPNVEATYLPKGNHPTSFGLATVVDPRNRGWNAETINSWYKPGSTGSNLKWIYENIGRSEIKYGRDAGKTVNEVIFGGQLDGSYANITTDENGEMTFENPSTIGWRSYVGGEKTRLTSDIKDFSEKDVETTVLGDSSKYNQDVMDAINGKTTKTAKTYPTYYPRSSYGYSSRAGGGDYNPKIYSNPRSVNADRAATMYTKAPQSAKTTYLNPSFSTKGSREAYKRQDI